MLRHIPFYASLLGREMANGKQSTNAQVLVYGAIEVHAMGDRGCIASDETIAAETGLKASSVSSIISVLKKSDWIYVQLSPQNKRLEIVPLIEATIPEKTAETRVKAKAKAQSRALTPIKAELESGLNIDTGLETGVNREDKSSLKKVKEVQQRGDYTEQDVQLTELLMQQVYKNWPNTLRKEMTWKDYNEMRKIREIDKRPVELIQAVIMRSQQDEFWSQNIRSVYKLRKQFDTLQIRGQKWFEGQSRRKTFKL